MSSIELKPCPFCGGEAEKIQSPQKSTTVYNYIKCRECGSMSHSFFAIGEAINAWNRRYRNRRADNKPIRQSCKSCKHYTPDPNYRDGYMGNCRYLEKIWEKPFYVNEARTECEHFQAAERINENGNET